MIAVPRLHRRSAILLLTLFSLLAVPSAFAAGKPGSGVPIDPTKNCTEWPTKKTVIALDPGHGGTDNGTGYDFNGDGTRDLHEKTVVRNIAEWARTTLVGHGYTVCLTRIDDNTTLGNSERGEFANSVGARLFVMIHLNGSTDPNVNHTITFWGKKGKDLAFSNYMLTKLKGLTAQEGDYVGQFANGALLTATMESTLTESAFLTNQDEAPLLSEVDSPRRQEIASAIANGIHSYLNP